MASASMMTGVPWHIEKLRMKDEDTKRHCHRCVYFSKNNRQCSIIKSNCFGSAHCEHYSETQKPISYAIYEEKINNYIEETKLKKENNKLVNNEKRNGDVVKEHFSNFAFMSEVCPDLVEIATLAEKYLDKDPNVSIFKIGLLGEKIVSKIFEKERIQYLKQEKQIDSIFMLKKEELIPDEIELMLTIIRIERNNAVHNNLNSKDVAIKLLKYAFDICNWYVCVYEDYNYKPNNN